MDLSNQTELENPDIMQEINFIGWLDRDERATMFFIIEKTEEMVPSFSKKAVNIK